jgi:MOSC domain-containing protein YiiM
MVSGLDLEASRGRVLVVGGCRIAIRGETRPCRLMDDQHPGLQRALDPHWRGGIYGQVLTGGTIRRGDPVAFEQDELF